MLFTTFGSPLTSDTGTRRIRTPRLGAGKRRRLIRGILPALLAVLATAAFPAESPEPQKLWALVIGVSKYTRAEPLQFAASDAASFAEFLKSPRGGGIPEDHVFLLLEEDASRFGIENVLGVLTDKVKKGDTVYVYVAGHGITKNRIGYFVPIDGDMTNPPATAVRFSGIKETVELGLAPARCRILVTDMCNAGRLGAAQSDVARKLEELTEEVLKLRGEKGTFLNLLASRPNQSSYELEDVGRGVFTHALLEALDGKGSSPGDAVVDAEKLVAYVRAAVPKYTNRQQEPIANDDFDPKLPLAFLDRPGPPPSKMLLETTLLILNADRARYSRLEWIDPKTQARVVRPLAGQQRIKIGALQPGDLELELHGEAPQPRKVRVKLQRGENPLDLLASDLRGGIARRPPANELAALAPIAPPQPQRAPAAGDSDESELLLRVENGTEVYVDGTSYGRSEGTRFHELRGLTGGAHVLRLVPSPDREQRFRVRLFRGRQVFDVRSGELRYVLQAPVPPAETAQTAALPAADQDLYRRFLQALFEERLIAPAGDCAWDFWTQMRDRLPADMQDRARGRLAVALGDRAQRTILMYLRGEDIRWNAAVFEEGATLLDRMRQIARRSTAAVESQQRFFAGRALLERGLHDAAITELRRAIELDAEASHAYNAIGLSLWKQNRLAEAVAPLETALRLTPEWNYPRNTLALVYFEQRRYREAEQQLRESIRINPEDSTAHRALAQLQILLGRWEEAERPIEQSLQFNPGNAYALETLGVLRANQGRADDAEAAFRLAIRIEPDEPSFRLRLAELLRRRSRGADAAQILERLAAEQPSNIEAVRAYASILAEQGKMREADGVFQRALVATPNDANLRVVYASFLREAKRERDAERQLRDALRKDARNAFAHYELALLQLGQKNVGAAERELGLAAAADARLAAPPKLLGEIRAAQKRVPEALEQYRKALDLAIDPNQRQEIREAIARAEESLLEGGLAEARRAAGAGQLAAAWKLYAGSFDPAKGLRSARDAILAFAAAHPREADAAQLPASPLRQVLASPFWAAELRREERWQRGDRAAAREAADAVGALDANTRRVLASSAFSRRNETFGIHALVARWGQRLIEAGDPAAARALMDAAVAQKIFGAVPDYSPLTIDSLLVPVDNPDPVRFADFDVERHPDRRAHEVYARAAAESDTLEAALRYLPALETERPDLELRLEMARAFDRRKRPADAVALLRPAAADARLAAQPELYADAVVALARAQCAAGDCAAGRAALEAARKTLPRNKKIEDALRNP